MAAFSRAGTDAANLSMSLPGASPNVLNARVFINKERIPLRPKTRYDSG
jgi:hypothetical protein